MKTVWRSRVLMAVVSCSVGVAPALAQVAPGVSAIPEPSSDAIAQTLAPGGAPPVARPITQAAADAAPAFDAAARDGAAFDAAGTTFARERVPFSRILVDLGTDVKNLASRDNLWIAGLGAGLALASHPADKRVTSGAFGSHPLDATFDSGEWLGGGLFQVGAALTAYTVGRVSHNAKLASVGRDIVRAQVLNTVLTQGIKFAVQRERPDGTNYSFPSGHASTAFATATVLSRYYGPKVGIPAYAMAAFVSANRLTENRHYLSDVAFGAAIGIISARTSTLHIGGARFALAPAATPNGGVGLSLVRVPKETIAH